MVAGSNVVKLTAKSVLKNNWISAVITCLTMFLSFYAIFIVISLLASVIPTYASTVIFILLVTFLLAPLLLGIFRNFWYLVNGNSLNPLHSFYYFSSKRMYLRALKLFFRLFLKGFGHSVIIFLPAIVFEIFSSEFIYELLDMPIPLWTTNFQYITVFLRTMAIVLLFFVMTRYYSAPVLTVGDDEMDVEEAIHMSVILSKGSLLEFIYLFFSFAGWIFISFFYFPFLFTMPYMITSYIVHTKFAIEDYNKRISDLEDAYSSYSVGV